MEIRWFDDLVISCGMWEEHHHLRSSAVDTLQACIARMRADLDLRFTGLFNAQSRVRMLKREYTGGAF